MTNPSSFAPSAVRVCTTSRPRTQDVSFGGAGRSVGAGFCGGAGLGGGIGFGGGCGLGGGVGSGRGAGFGGGFGRFRGAGLNFAPGNASIGCIGCALATAARSTSGVTKRLT